jgi:hypothetical protein
MQFLRKYLLLENCQMAITKQYSSINCLISKVKNHLVIVIYVTSLRLIAKRVAYKLLFPPSAFKFRFLIVIYVYKNFVMKGGVIVLR